jgi:hypothetical protein
MLPPYNKQTTLLLRDLAVGFLALLLVSAAIGEALWRGGLADRSIIDVKTQIAADYKPDFVFLGTSHFDYGLQPETFDAAMAEHGVISRSFDLTFGGLSVAEIPPTLDAFFKLRPCCPKYIVLEAAFMQTDIGWSLPNNVRTIIYFNIFHAIDFLRLTFAYNALPSDQGRWDYVRNVALATAMHYSNLGMGASLLDFSTPLESLRWTKKWGSGGNSEEEPSAGEIRYAYARGVSGLLQVRPKYLAGQMPPPMIPGTFVNDEMLGYFIDAVREIERHGIGVIVVQPPMQSFWQYVADFVSGFQRRCGGARLVDFSDPAEYEDFYRNLSFWRDGSHLSKFGAPVWSKLVAERIAPIVKQDEAAGKPMSACPG